MDYHVNINKGLINVHTLSPNKLFYYKIKHAKEINKSAFACPISFYDLSQKLIYYKENTFAHELHSARERTYYRNILDANNETQLYKERVIKLVNWSTQGNWCYFLEYSGIGIIKRYESVFLDCKNKCSYRIDDLTDNGEFVNKNVVIDSPFDESVIFEKLKLKNIRCEDAIPDIIGAGLFNVITKRRWYP